MNQVLVDDADDSETQLRAQLARLDELLGEDRLTPIDGIMLDLGRSCVTSIMSLLRDNAALDSVLDDTAVRNIVRFIRGTQERFVATQEASVSTKRVEKAKTGAANKAQSALRQQLLAGADKASRPNFGAILANAGLTNMPALSAPATNAVAAKRAAIPASLEAFAAGQVPQVTTPTAAPVSSAVPAKEKPESLAEKLRRLREKNAG